MNTKEASSLDETGVEDIIYEETHVASYCCEICEKDFKSESHLAQHVASKPHRKKVQELEKKSKVKSRIPSTALDNVSLDVAPQDVLLQKLGPA